MTRQLIVGGVATLIAVAYFIGGRGYPWPLALMIGTAVGALVFSSLRAGDRMRSLRDRDRS